VLQEHVVAAPQEAEGRHRHQEMRARRHLGGVVAKQPAVVVDMLQHVHHQHQVAVGWAGVAAVEHRLADHAVVALAGVADIDAEGGLRGGLGQQMAREEARARADIEDAPGREAGHGAAQCRRLGAVVPMPADLGA